MNKVIIVSYTEGDYDDFFELYSYSPAVVEMLKEDLKEYLRGQGFYLSTVEDWKKWAGNAENWEGDTPVYASNCASSQIIPQQEVGITWESVDKNDEIYVTDEYNITLKIWKKEVVEAVENFDFGEE